MHYAHEHSRKGAGHNLLSPTMKWTWLILYKQQLTADQRIPVKGGESKKVRWDW